MKAWIKEAFEWFVIRQLAYVFVCWLGWKCKRNFTSTLGCRHCWRTGYETLRGRRYFGRQHCKEVREEMRRNRGL